MGGSYTSRRGCRESAALIQVGQIQSSALLAATDGTNLFDCTRPASVLFCSSCYSATPHFFVARAQRCGVDQPGPQPDLYRARMLRGYSAGKPPAPPAAAPSVPPAAAPPVPLNSAPTWAEGGPTASIEQPHPLPHHQHHPLPHHQPHPLPYHQPHRCRSQPCPNLGREGPSCNSVGEAAPPGAATTSRDLPKAHHLRPRQCP